MRAGSAARAGMAGGGGRREGGQDRPVCPTGLERGVGNLGVTRAHPCGTDSAHWQTLGRTGQVQEDSGIASTSVAISPTHHSAHSLSQLGKLRPIEHLAR